MKRLALLVSFLLASAVLAGEPAYPIPSSGQRWEECVPYDGLLLSTDPIKMHAFVRDGRTLDRITCSVTGTVAPTATITTQYRTTANGAATELEAGTVCDEDGTDQTSGFTATAIPAARYLTIDITATGGTTRDGLMVCLAGTRN